LPTPGIASQPIHQKNQSDLFYINPMPCRLFGMAAGKNISGKLKWPNLSVPGFLPASPAK
jgi:hypothetical protein